MKRTLIATLTLTATFLQADEPFVGWFGGRPITAREAISIDSIQTQLALEQQQLNELQAIHRLQQQQAREARESQQCQPRPMYQWLNPR